MGIVSTLERAREALRTLQLPSSQRPWKIGVGVASGYKNVGLGLGNDDSTTRSMLEGILSMEEEHADDLASLLATMAKKR